MRLTLEPILGSAPPPITTEDLVANLEEIEMLTATGNGLDAETTMRVHLLAGIGRATHDSHAWYQRSEIWGAK